MEGEASEEDSSILIMEWPRIFILLINPIVRILLAKLVYLSF